MSDNKGELQESILERMCGRSMSAPFVFKQDPLKERKGEKRFSDRFWCCNNTVLLMWMTGSKNYADAEKNKKTFADDQRHNFDQAKKWMKYWKRKELTGENVYQRIWIPFKDCVRVAILSIVKSGSGIFSTGIGQSFAEVRVDFAAQLGVKRYAAVPQSFMELLMARGGSVLDLFTLLREFRDLGAIPEKRAIEMLNEYFAHCLQEVNELKPENYGLEPSNSLVANLAVVALNLAKLRHRPKAKPSGKKPIVHGENIGAAFGILADMDYANFGAIAKAIAICEELSKRKGEPVSMELSLSDYDCQVCAAQRVTDAPYLKETYEAWAKPRLADEQRPGLFFSRIMETGHLGMDAVSRSGPSYTEQLLDNFNQPDSPSSQA
jgi:hypothetical protein